MGAIQSVPHRDALPPMHVRLDAGACMPTKRTRGAAGYDLSAVEKGEVAPYAVAMVHTGVYASIPHGLFGAIKGRSGLARSGILAFEGVVDSDYRGEICILLYNTRGVIFSYCQGQRIGQMVFLPHVELNMRETPELDPTPRGDGGFGSTDDPSQVTEGLLRSGVAVDEAATAGRGIHP